MRSDLIMSMLMGGVFIYAVVEADQWDYGSALFPRVIGIAGLIAVGVLLVVHLLLRRIPAAEAPAATGPSAEPLPPQERRIAARFLGWLVTLVAGAWLFGQLAALTGFIVLYLRFESGVSWLRAAAIGALSWAFLYGVFELVLQITWIEGALWRWIGGR